MHVELMQCMAREMLNDRIREAETARAIKSLRRSQREEASNGMWRWRWTRRRSATVVGIPQR